jgi:hypothetical protein
MNRHYPFVNISQMALKFRLVFLTIAGVIFSAPALMARPASAVLAITIQVNTPTDSNTADDFLSLREAFLLVKGGIGGDGLVTGLGQELTANEMNQVTGGTFGLADEPANSVFTNLGGAPTIALAQGTGVANESLPPILTSGVMIDGLSGVGVPVKIDGSGAGVPADSDIL